MSTVTNALPTVGSVVTLLVMIGALIWVTMAVRGRPRGLAAVGLALMILGVLLQLIWSLAANAIITLDSTALLLQVGWLLSDLIRLVGLVLVVAAVVVGRTRPGPSHPTMPPAAYGPPGGRWGPPSH